MVKHEEGFFYRNKIYYGCYNKKQVSRQGNISIIKLEYIQSDHSIYEDDWAVRL